MDARGLRNPSSEWPVVRLSVARCAALLLAAGVACEPSERLEVQPYCDYRNEYEIWVPDTGGLPAKMDFEGDVLGPTTVFYCFADDTADAYPGSVTFPGSAEPNGDCASAWVESIEPFCAPDAPAEGLGNEIPHEQALVIRYGKHDSWGGRYSNWNWFGTPQSTRLLDVLGEGAGDAQDYEGIALWAKAGPASDRFTYVLLDDASSADHEGGNCVEPVATIEGADADQQQVIVSSDPNVDTSTSAPQGAVPDESHCNNSYRQLMQVSDRWELHLLPFEDFYQDKLPNHQSQGIGTMLHKLSFEFSRGNSMELWIDQIMLYRRRPESSED
jgi:hypothetical protein